MQETDNLLLIGKMYFEKITREIITDLEQTGFKEKTLNAVLLDVGGNMVEAAIFNAFDTKEKAEMILKDVFEEMKKNIFENLERYQNVKKEKK